jgi:hypothetical protein
MPLEPTVLTCRPSDNNRVLHLFFYTSQVAYRDKCKIFLLSFLFILYLFWSEIRVIFTCCEVIVLIQFVHHAQWLFSDLSDTVFWSGFGYLIHYSRLAYFGCCILNDRICGYRLPTGSRYFSFPVASRSTLEEPTDSSTKWVLEAYPLGVKWLNI